MTDLRETLDRAIPLVPEPSVPLPGAAERVHHGRRVLRRRRIVGGAGAVVVAAVVLAGAVAIVPIGPGNDSPWQLGASPAAEDEQVAHDLARVAAERAAEERRDRVRELEQSKVQTRQLTVDDLPRFEDEGESVEALFGQDGVLLIRPGASVVRVEDRSSETGWPLAAALITERDGVISWTVAISREPGVMPPDGGAVSTTPEAARGMTFAQWVHEVEASSRASGHAADEAR